MFCKGNESKCIEIGVLISVINGNIRLAQPFQMSYQLQKLHIILPRIYCSSIMLTVIYFQ